MLKHDAAMRAIAALGEMEGVTGSLTVHKGEKADNLKIEKLDLRLIGDAEMIAVGLMAMANFASMKKSEQKRGAQPREGA